VVAASGSGAPTTSQGCFRCGSLDHRVRDCKEEPRPDRRPKMKLPNPPDR
jgi:hypothetical protein